MRTDMKGKKTLARFAAIVASLLIGLAFATAGNASAAGEDKNVVAVVAAAVNPALQPKVLIFPVAVKGVGVTESAAKADSKVPTKRDAASRKPFSLNAPFFLENPFEEIDEEFD